MPGPQNSLEHIAHLAQNIAHQSSRKALLGELLRTHRVSSPINLFVSSCVCPLDKSAWEMEIWGQWKIFSFPHYKQWV